MNETHYDTHTGASITDEHTRLRPAREGNCPTCGKATRFIFLGEQRWPEKVAAKLDLPAIMLQWRCEHCQTTLTEPDTAS
jgi:hypothetical protein